MMSRLHRIALVITVLAAMPALAGCSSFDPDQFDFFGLTEKKKIPGDRKALFPEGVPGVSQGVPPQYIKGNQATAETALAAPAPEAAPPPPEQPKAEPQPKPKRKAAAAKPKPAAPVQPVTQQPQQPQQANPQQQPWPQGSQPAPSGTAAWPAPPPPGTFSR
jgi:outer membrane biosynthesis protein TonB